MQTRKCACRWGTAADVGRGGAGHGQEQQQQQEAVQEEEEEEEEGENKGSQRLDSALAGRLLGPSSSAPPVNRGFDCPEGPCGALPRSPSASASVISLEADATLVALPLGSGLDMIVEPAGKEKITARSSDSSCANAREERFSQREAPRKTLLLPAFLLPPLLPSTAEGRWNTARTNLLYCHIDFCTCRTRIWGLPNGAGPHRLCRTGLPNGLENFSVRAEPLRGRRKRGRGGGMHRLESDGDDHM